MTKKRLFLWSMWIAVMLCGAALIIGAGAGGSAYAQSSPAFQSYRTIGESKPGGLLYNQAFDQWIVVNDGDLEVVDARTNRTIAELYSGRIYNHYALSNDGRWLAVAVGTRVELWELAPEIVLRADIEPNGSRGIQAPLIFSQDDTYLLMSVVVPERQELRRSENDTAIIPWIWDLPNARDEARSRLPGLADAYPFFDYRTGFILGPNNIAVAALPRRLQFIDVGAEDLPVVNELETGRFEQDRVDVWFSETDPIMYHRVENQGVLYQINTETNFIQQIPLGRQLNAPGIRTLEEIRFSRLARIIGDANSREGNSLLRALLGFDYARSYGNHPLTVMLIDSLEPVTVPEDQASLLIYILDEETGRGSFDLIRPTDVLYYAFNPDGNQIALRYNYGDQPVEIYDLDTGNLYANLVSPIPDNDRDEVLAFTADGDELLVGLQRFDVSRAPGELIIERLQYNDGFSAFYFAADSRGLVTRRDLPEGGFEWWLWDLETEQVVRRERVRIGNGQIIASDPDGSRFLLRTDRTNTGGTAEIGVEVVDINRDDRQRLTFEQLPRTNIQNIIPNDDWSHFLVVYGAPPGSQHYPGDEVMIYSLERGRLYHYAGADLPVTANRQYRWIDSDTAYISGQNTGEQPPERIYGLAFDPSGVPTCLVEAFPNEWERWRDLWDRLNVTLQPGALMRLAARLCAAQAETVAEVDALFFPTATPTRPPITATPAVIAGVPVCLTQRFSREAVGYAQSWRELTEGLTPEAIAELEALLCEGLSGASAPPPDEASEETPTEVYLFEVSTGERSVGSFIPFVREDVASLQVVLDEFQRQNGFTPSNAILSPNRQLLAYGYGDQYVTVQRIITPYSLLAANATATVELARADDPRRISVRPTSTAAFTEIGGARPTLTATVSPTPPPLATQMVVLAQRDQVMELLDPTVYPMTAPPADFAPSGRILLVDENNSYILVLDPATGAFTYSDTIPPCGLDLNCVFNQARTWFYTTENGLVVSQPDGTGAVILINEVSEDYLSGVRWIDNDVLEYRYEGYEPGGREAVNLAQRYNLTTGEFGTPFRPPGSVRINDLPTNIVSTQPGEENILVLRQDYNGIDGGYRYFIYDRATGEYEYFARFIGTGVNFEWHPSGDALYYFSDENRDVWYRYDAATRHHEVLGEPWSGYWSRNGRYQAEAFFITAEESEERIESGLPIPNFQIRDRETGALRLYSVAELSDAFGFMRLLQWSPDDRYIAGITVLPDEQNGDVTRPRLLILDTQTGKVVVYDDPNLLYLSDIVTWTE